MRDKKKIFQIQVQVNDLVSFQVYAKDITEAIELGKKELRDINLYDSDVEVIDTNEEVVGAY